MLGSTLVRGGGGGNGAGTVRAVASPGITVETTPGTIGTCAGMGGVGSNPPDDPVKPPATALAGAAS